MIRFVGKLFLSKKPAALLLVLFAILTFSLFHANHAYAASETYVETNKNTFEASGGAFDNLQDPQPIQFILYKTDSTGQRFYDANVHIKDHTPGAQCETQNAHVMVFVTNRSGAAQGSINILCGVITDPTTGTGNVGGGGYPGSQFASIGGNQNTSSIKVTSKTATVTPVTQPSTSGNETYSFVGGQGTTIHACSGIFNQFSGSCLDFPYGQSFDSPATGAPTGSFNYQVTAKTLPFDTCTVTLSIGIPAGSQPNSASQTSTTAYLITTTSPTTSNCSKLDLKGITTQFPTRQQIAIKGAVTTFLGQTYGTPDGAAAGAKTCADGSDPDSAGNCAPALSCGAGALNWIVCIVIDAAKSSAGVIDNMIMKSLDTDVTTIFDTQNSGCSASAPCVQNGYYTAWNSFRILATALLVIGGLIMVASQAFGFEILDAYTVRKVLPRLLIAIIGISLSWPLMRFVVQFFDTLGFDIRNLIYGPFSHLGGTISFATGALTWLGAGAAILLLGPATLSFLVTIFFALLIGFLIIVFRQLAIVVLIIIAPLAIAFYILPNTQKLWKLWYDNFLGLMLVFPIISAFIATGHVFSAVSLASSTTSGVTDSTLKQAIGLLAYFIPYFVLPLAFRMATGVIGNIAGFANDRGRGIFDRQKKKRQAAMADRIGRAKGEALYSNDTARGKLGNKLASWATAPGASIAYAGRNKIPGLKRAGKRIETQIEHARFEQSGKLFESLNKMGYNDKAYRALSGQHRDLSAETQGRLANAGLLHKAPTSMADIEKMGAILSQSSGETERIGGNALTGSAGYLGNLYKDPEMGKASVQAAGIMGLAAHGFADGEDLAGAGNALMGATFQATQARDATGKLMTDAGGNAVYEKDEKGRTKGSFVGGKIDHHQAAFSQAIVTQAQMLGARSRPDTKPGYGVVYDKATGTWVDGMSVKGGRARQVIKTLASHDLAGAKGGSIRKLEPTIKAVLSEGLNPPAGATIEQKAMLARERTAVQDQLFSWAGPHTQASLDVKTEALRIIAENGLQADFDRFTRTTLDPRAIGEDGQPPVDNNLPPGTN